MLGLPVMAGVTMSFPSEMTPASQEDLRLLANRLASQEGRLAGFDQWRMSHAGIEASGVGTDYPHPIQRVRSLTFGSRQGLLTADGIFLVGDADRSIFTNIYWVRDVDNERGLTGSRAYIAAAAGAGVTNDPVEMTIGVESIDPSGQIARLRMITADAGITGSVTLSYIDGMLYIDDTGVYVNHVGSATEKVSSDGDWSTKTIASGVLTVTTSRHKVDTQGATATDDLDTISSGTDGQLLILTAVSAARVVTAKDGTGNLKLAGGDFVFTNITDTLMLVKQGSNFLEISRSTNA